jgi:uncharacterized protein
MAMRTEETFAVKAPATAVWAFLVDPRRVVTCLPGAELTAVVDDRTFDGQVRVKVGAMTIAYRGCVRLAELDQPNLVARMSAEGREGGGAGFAKMTMESRLTALPGGGTEVTVRADVDVAGRLVQLGRGMLEQVSHQLFQQFAACVRATLEAEARAGGAEATAPEGSGAAVFGAPLAHGADARAYAAATGLPARAGPLKLVPLLMRALWAWALSLFRRGKGSGAASGP